MCYNLEDYVLQMKWQFQKVWQTARDYLEKGKQVKLQESEFSWEKGQLVVWSKNRKAPWEGPYEISEVNGKNITIIRLGVATRSKRKIVHESQLKLHKLRK